MCGRTLGLRRLVAIATCVAVLVATWPVMASVIDDFSVGGTSVTGSGVAVALQQQIGLDPNHVVGGGRNISVGGSGASVQTLNIDAAAGELRFLTGAGPGLGYFDITYGTAVSPLNLDLTSGGANAFYFITKWDIGGSLFNQPPNFLSVFTSSGESISSVSDVRGGIVTVLPDGRRQVVVPFSAFTPQFDPTKVLRIELDFVRIQQSSEFTLSAFRTIPEPGGCLLFMIGMSGWILGRRARLIRQVGAGEFRFAAITWAAVAISLI